ncbi:MAG TPA: ABC transporter ATP-binding protein [Dongiaceae bacterium]|nr:ABC transporter ATP-binding protein [Dongiaceae bacterium]
MSRLTLRDLRVFFDRPRTKAAAVDGISLDLRSGSVLALIGESGSGKTMTALSLLGLTPPEAEISGHLETDSHSIPLNNVTALAALRGREIGLIFQDPLSSLNPVICVGEQVAEVFRRHAAVTRKMARAATSALLQQLGLPDPGQRLHDYPHQFSGGQRQRIAIAMAIAANPRFLIADEPTTALDVTIQAQLMELLQHLVEAGMGLLLITHDIALAAENADEIAIIYAGRIVESGACADLVTRPRHPYTALLLATALATDPRQITNIDGGDAIGEQSWQSGCAFAPRCPAATGRCRSETPALATAEGNKFACHHPLALPESRS